MRVSRRWIWSFSGPSISDRVLRPLLLALLVWITAGAALAQDKRVALVIGNAAYRHVSELANPVNDSGDMSAAVPSSTPA